MGRFTSPDSLVPDPYNPLDWDRYQYARANPVRFNDPSGHRVSCGDGETGACGGETAESRYNSERQFNLACQNGSGKCPDYKGIAAFTVASLGAAGAAGPAIDAIGGTITGWFASTTAATATSAACANGACGRGASAFDQAVQNGLNDIQGGLGQYYNSFGTLKGALGPAGPNMQWHHIVGQFPGNVSKFGQNLIQSTNNLIAIPTGIHQDVSAYYSSIQQHVTGSATITVRQWVASQSFQAQWEFGMQVIQQFGGAMYAISQFGGS